MESAHMQPLIAYMRYETSSVLQKVVRAGFFGAMNRWSHAVVGSCPGRRGDPGDARFQATRTAAVR